MNQYLAVIGYKVVVEEQMGVKIAMHLHAGLIIVPTQNL